MRRPKGAAAERGSISVFLTILIPGLFLIVALAVDGGAKVAALQRADAVAEEAARAGGQALDIAGALNGELQVEPAAAVAAAEDYLRRSGVEGLVDVLDGDTLRVTTTLTEPTVFLGLVGIDSFTVHGTGTAALVTSVTAGSSGP